MQEIWELHRKVNGAPSSDECSRHPRRHRSVDQTCLEFPKYVHHGRRVAPPYVPCVFGLLVGIPRYAVGSAVAGFIDLADTFRRDVDNFPKEDYYALFVDALKKIKWLDIDG